MYEKEEEEGALGLGLHSIVDPGVGCKRKEKGLGLLDCRPCNGCLGMYEEAEEGELGLGLLRCRVWRVSWKGGRNRIGALGIM